MKFNKVNRLPLIIIGGIFICLLIVVNVSVHTMNKTPLEKIQLGLLQIFQEDYELYGEISLKGKAQQPSIVDDMKFLYNGIIKNSTSTIKLDTYIVSGLLNIDKKIGTLYKTKDNIIIEPITEQYGLFYYEYNKNYNPHSVEGEVKSLTNLLKDKTIYQTKEAITIKQNYLSQKIMTNKISIELLNEDLKLLISKILGKKHNINEELLNAINNHEFKILISIYLDNRNHIRKIEMLYEDVDYEVSITNLLQDYNSRKKILVPEIEDRLAINNLEEKELVEILTNIFGLR